MTDPDQNQDTRRWIWRTRRGLAELGIIVIGILLAFQVEEWREERAEQRDVLAALDRLLEEAESNRLSCNRALPYIQANAAAMEHVFDSLTAGHYVDGDRERFDHGLIVFDVVPDIRLNTSVAAEMVSTGLLKEVHDTALQGLIAGMPAKEAESRDQLPYWRQFIVLLFDELMTLVEFSYAEGSVVTDDQTNQMFWTERRMRVSYDFADLAGNRRLRNLFFEAVDVHGDLLDEISKRCGLVEDILAILDAG